jgi:hypothetical protein
MAMKTKVLTGKNEDDLNRQQWEWQSQSKIVIKRKWPDERLPLAMKPPTSGKIEALDQVSRRIHYEVPIAPGPPPRS